jgi:hypothetical protein
VPQVIVTAADCCGDQLEGAVTLREWVNLADFDSEHFVAQLIERLAWAVGDAHGSEASVEPEHALSPRPAARPWTTAAHRGHVLPSDREAQRRLPGVREPQRAQLLVELVELVASLKPARIR